MQWHYRLAVTCKENVQQSTALGKGLTLLTFQS